MTGVAIGSIKARDEILEVVVVVIAFRMRLLDTFVLVCIKLVYHTTRQVRKRISLWINRFSLWIYRFFFFFLFIFSFFDIYIFFSYQIFRYTGIFKFPISVYQSEKLYQYNQYSKPSNTTGVRFVENAAIVKTAIVETKGQWEERGLVPALRENIEDDRRQPEINTLQLK